MANNLDIPINCLKENDIFQCINYHLIMVPRPIAYNHDRGFAAWLYSASQAEFSMKRFVKPEDGFTLVAAKTKILVVEIRDGEYSTHEQRFITSYVNGITESGEIGWMYLFPEVHLRYHR